VSDNSTFYGTLSGLKREDTET